MSINSINYDEMTNIASSWNFTEEDTRQSRKRIKSAEVRRRIEAMREIRESGLTMEEAEELGLLC